MSSTLVSFAVALLDALARGRAFSYFGPAMYSQTDGCIERNYQCWFRQWGNVTSSQVSPTITLCQDDENRREMSEEETKTAGLSFGLVKDSPMRVMVDRGVFDPKTQQPCVEAANPEELQWSRIAWKGSAVLAYVMTPNERVANELDKLQRELG